MQNALARISIADYIDGEERGEIRHEYVDGEVFAMSGATQRHNLIVTNLLREASTAALSRPPCKVFTQSMKVKIESRNVFYYPDIVGTCSVEDDEEYYLTRPCFVIEVLSPSTAAIDRREKRVNYGLLPSLREYVLVDQDRRRVDVYYRHEANGEFSAMKLEDSGTLRLSCLDNLSLSLDDIYRAVELPSTIAEPEAPAYAA